MAPIAPSPNAQPTAAAPSEFQTAQNAQHHDALVVPMPKASTPNLAAAHPSHADLHIAAFDREVRSAFVAKVFSILSLQLATTCAFVVLGTSGQLPLEELYLYAAIGASLVVILAVSCTSAPRQHPLGLILLVAFTIAESYIVAWATTLAAPKLVIMAAGITLGIVAVLGLYAVTTKSDLTGMGPYLFVGVIGLMTFGLILWFVPLDKVKTAHKVYACLGVLIFSAFLVYDLQLVVGGKHRRFQFSVDDYILASLVLYMDIINIFLDILRLLNLSCPGED
eukprot:CAMPEP_0202078638 /NCGR_PEP_ID=MMETSP0964-20121228/6050_1 /ASSEMBLY_ACC=CAM_ASM_000500 /TAXON_ID=4773 /ORGANISM="Schizochytrium aggregatum, Strain ATCC28209" /LENGTH=279 /DNA_ID=CAMNT_0048645951 /DNA_START=117 /DNA_END=956 /DNA_ORIENTATION=-